MTSKRAADRLNAVMVSVLAGIWPPKGLSTQAEKELSTESEAETGHLPEHQGGGVVEDRKL